MIGEIFQDWSSNPRDPRARFVLAFFRLAHIASRHRRNPFCLAIGASYRVLVTYILGIELPWKTNVGPRLRLYHGVGLVVNDGVRIGADVTLRQGVTLGTREELGPCPVIGSDVVFGANCIVLGSVEVGSGARIDAGAVVLSDVLPGAVMVGNPARSLGEANR